MFQILQTDEFGTWFISLDSEAKEDIYAAVDVLKQEGPALGRPFRIIFAFDPKRNGVLLIGGNKQGNKNFYKKIIPIAERLYEEYLKG